MREDSSDLVLEFFGAFEPYDIPATDATRQDLYSVFLSRATSMRWSEALSPLPAMGSLWGMAEADLLADSRAAGGAIAQFQVVAIGDPALPMPIQPLIQCAVESLRRLGEFRLDGLRLGLPLALHGDDGRRHIASTNWFHAARWSKGVAIAASLTVGDHVVQVAAEIGRRHIAPFSVAVSPDAPADELRIIAPEWSAEAAGWVTSEVADAAVRLGIRSDALIEVWHDAGAAT